MLSRLIPRASLFQSWGGDMAIKIHHGPNGSYKTSGAVMDDVIPAIKAGRHVITNIRGMSEARCKEAFPDAPGTFALEYLDMDSHDGLERCRTFFQWAPPGALIIFDETQLLFLTSWKPADLKRFDFPGGPEAAHAANVPASWLDAWTRHRHWNWDIVLTTPNIKYIRGDIRLTCEAAYRHSNLGLLGPIFKKLLGDYKEAFHDAQINVPPPKAITKFKRIKKQVWSLYDSTTTGVVKDTSAGTSIFASIPLLVGLVVAVCAVGYSFASGGYSHFLSGSSVRHADAVALPDSPDRGVSVHAVSDGVRSPVVSVVTELPLTKYLKKSSISVSGITSINREKIVEFLFQQDADSFPVSSKDLAKLGVVVKVFGQCMVSIEYLDQFGEVVGCHSQADSSDSVLPEAS